MVFMCLVTANNLIVALIVFSKWPSGDYIVFLIKLSVLKIIKWNNSKSQVSVKKPTHVEEVSIVESNYCSYNNVLIFTY